MRTVFDPQMTFGQVDIADIKLNTKSRDDIPQLLRGLQQHPHRPRIAQERLCHPWGNAPRACGRGRQGQPGMAQWNILVLGVLRLGLNAVYRSLSSKMSHFQF